MKIIILEAKVGLFIATELYGNLLLRRWGGRFSLILLYEVTTLPNRAHLWSAYLMQHGQARSQDFNRPSIRRSQEGLHVVASAEGAKPLPTRGSEGAS